MGLIRVLSFAGLTFLVARMLILAPEGGTIRRLAGHAWLSMIGRHSLPVFAFHVLLIYLLRLLTTHLGGIPDPWYSLLGLLAIASLLLPAWLLETWRNRSLGTAAVPATS